MNKSPIMVQLNILEFTKSIIEHVGKACNFCYPDNNLNLGRTHAQLMKIGVFSSNLTNVFEMIEKDHGTNPLVIFFLELVKKINSQWAYPDNTFDENRAHATLQKIGGQVQVFNIACQSLILHIMNNNPTFIHINVDLVQFLEQINIENTYNYTYPENKYDSSRGHVGAQCMQGHNICLENFFLNISKENHSVVKLILDDIYQAVKTLHNTTEKMYPDGFFAQELGHKLYSSYITHYRETKKSYKKQCVLAQELDLPSLYENNTVNVVKEVVKEVIVEPVKEEIIIKPKRRFTENL